MTTRTEREAVDPLRTIPVDKPLPAGKDYHAFISYKRDPDEPIAAALERGLHTLARPWRAWRAMRVFRDLTGIPAAHDLGAAIRTKLDRSEYLILLASPEAFARIEPDKLTWVEQELDHWLTRGGGETKLLLCVTGETRAHGPATLGSEWRQTGAFPDRWKERLKTEPAYVDLTWARDPANSDNLTLREPRFANAVAQLSETIRGIDRAILFSEDQRQHRLLVRFRRFSLGGLIALLIASVAFAIWALFSAARAELQRQHAFTQQSIARTEQQLATRARERSNLSSWSAHRNERVARLNAREAGLQRDDAERQTTINMARRFAAEAESARELPERRALLAVTAATTVARSGIGDLQIEQALRSAWHDLGGSVPFHHSGMSAWAISPDGKILATGARDGSIRTWKVDDERPAPRVLRTDGGTVSDLTFSPDGQWLMSAASWGFSTRNEGIDLWRVQDGRSVSESRQLAKEIQFAPTEEVVAVHSWDGSVHVWPITQKGLGTARQLAAPRTASAMAFSADGSWFAIGNTDGTATVWRANALFEEKPSPEILLGHQAAHVTTVLFSPGGRWLVTSAELPNRKDAAATPSRNAYLWELSTDGTPSRKYELPLSWEDRTFRGNGPRVATEPNGSNVPPKVVQAGFNADGRWLFLLTHGGVLQLWHLPEWGQKPTAEDLRGHVADGTEGRGSSFHTARFHPYGDLVAAGAADGVYLASLSTSSTPAFDRLSGTVAGDSVLRFSEEGRYLFASAGDGKLRIWDCRLVTPVPSVLTGTEGRLVDAATIGGDRWLLGMSATRAGETGSVRRYRFDPKAGPFLSTTLAVIESSDDAILSPDSNWLAFESLGETVLVVVSPSAAVRFTHAVQGSLLREGFSPKSRWLMTADENCVLFTRLGTNLNPVARQLKTGEAQRDPLPRELLVDDTLWDPQERWLIVSNVEGSNWLFEATADEAPVFRRRLTDAGWGGGAAFSDDGQWLYIQETRLSVESGKSAPFGRVRLFDLRTPGAVPDHEIPLPVVRSATFAGNYVAFSDEDGTAFVWRLPFASEPPFILPMPKSAKPPIGSQHYPNLEGLAPGWIVTMSSRVFLWDVTVTPPRPHDITRRDRVPNVPLAKRIVVSDNRRWLVVLAGVGGDPAPIVLCRLSGKDVVCRLLPAVDGVSTIDARFSPDGRWLAVGGSGRQATTEATTNIALWKLDDGNWGTKPNPLRKHENDVVGFEFSSDGRYLVSAANDRSIVAWNLSASNPALASVVLRDRAGRSFTQIFVDSRIPAVLATQRDGRLGVYTTFVDRIPIDSAAILASIPDSIGRPFTDEERYRFPTAAAPDPDLARALEEIDIERVILEPDAGNPAGGASTSSGEVFADLPSRELMEKRPRAPRQDDADLENQLALLHERSRRLDAARKNLRWWHFNAIVDFLAGAGPTN